MVYQIYPRSFADADGDGVGDLRGIAAHLDHLRGTSRSLGVDAIWLSPIYPSPLADFGYDVSDYTDVDPLYGTLDDLDALVQGAHTHGLRVLLDWIPNHTSHCHPWFVESRASRTSARRDWYVWRDPRPDGRPPNNWRSAFDAVGSAWTLDEVTGQYYLHSFASEQPDLNWDNPAVERAMHDTLRFWLERGVDGFRVDVVDRLGKDPSLADNPSGIVLGAPQRGARDEDWPIVHDRLRRIRGVAEQYGSDRLLVGEVFILDTRRMLAYVNSGTGLHLAHNFVFAYTSWEADAMRSAVDAVEDQVAAGALPCWFLGNHDMSRVVTRFGGGDAGQARARVAAMLLFTLRGTVFMYQGEELGLPDTPIPPEYRFDISSRDPERTPIPWRPPSLAGHGAGFTTGEPWLPVTPEAERLNVERQTADPTSMFALYRQLIALRRATPALRLGTYRALDAAPDVYAYERAANDEFIVVALNLASEPRPLPDAAVCGWPLLSTAEPRGERRELAPDEGVIFRRARGSSC